MTVEIGMLLFPNVTQLDLTGPHEVLARMPGARVTVVAKSEAPITSESGLVMTANATFASAPAFDLVFVPGGGGQIAATDDAETLDYLRTCATRAKWMTSACTGALLLGAAGLLRGYRAATHWAFMDLLPLVGATPVGERVVVDRDRITGGGVTAGIDIALAIVSLLAGTEAAERICLQLEYGPIDNPALVSEVRAKLAGRYAEREAQLRRITGSG
ncbi:MAG: DJ-1/PfpI family protein [Myxococcota bacterium]|nr:DJ-1/PfpI family protein [Myxococcota bacterium]